VLSDQSPSIILEAVDNTIGQHVKEINVWILSKCLRKVKNTPAV